MNDLRHGVLWAVGVSRQVWAVRTYVFHMRLPNHSTNLTIFVRYAQGETRNVFKKTGSKKLLGICCYICTVGCLFQLIICKNIVIYWFVSYNLYLTLFYHPSHLTRLQISTLRVCSMHACVCVYVLSTAKQHISDLDNNLSQHSMCYLE